ncbi:MAG: hypothetical protein ACXVAP_07725 [Candidatus Limnocylindrales bacterium]
MAQRALPPGVSTHRAFFGLLDADGWGYAFWKALFWFALIIFLLGYVPDRAYYFTVLPTVDLGYNVISPINFCDASNDGLPCPAPAGAVVPWQPNPAELALPRGRTGAGNFQSGTQLYLVGGLVDGTPTDSVLQTATTSSGTYSAWTDGPKLPAPRADAALVSFNGVPYLLGGTGADGKPVDTIIVGEMSNGALTGWKIDDARKLPVALTGASAVASGTGIWLIGGKAEAGLSNKVYRARLDSTVKPAILRDFTEEPTLAVRLGSGEPAPRAFAAGLLAGSQLFLVGGDGPQGPSDQIFRLTLDSKGEPVTDANGQVVGWGQSTGASALPAPRSHFAGFTANGALYVPGGLGADGKPNSTFYWAVPNPTSGDLAQWSELSVTELGQPIAGGTTAVVGSYAFLIGGVGADGAALNGTARANLAPKSPFFRLGFLGMTIPGLALTGNTGQQLGFLMAGIVGGTNFILLILIGVAYSHQAQSRHLLERLSRGRYRAPREDEYFGE